MSTNKEAEFCCLFINSISELELARQRAHQCATAIEIFHIHVNVQYFNWHPSFFLRIHQGHID